MQKRLVSLLDLKENQRLLDLGCGTGCAVRHTASLVHDREEFDGIDISSKMIEKAEASFPAYKNVHFYKTAADSRENVYGGRTCLTEDHGWRTRHPFNSYR